MTMPLKTDVKLPKAKAAEIDHASRAHSSLVGGSSADRVLNCPKSVSLLDRIPDDVKNKSSKYADEGTALHEAVTYLLEADDIVDPFSLVGMTFGPAENPTKITRRLVETAVKPSIDFFDQLDEEFDSEGGMTFYVEKQFEFPGIPGAFGTGDLLARTDKRSIILDWKFGEGVLVSASYKEEDGSIRPNSQLMFYGRAAKHSYPEMFEDDPNWPVELIIVQPRACDAEEIFSRYTTTVGELEAFRFKLIAAVSEAQSAEPRCKEGPWCKFQACQSICPEKTKPLLDLSRLDLEDVKKNRVQTAEPVSPEWWGQLYANYLPICDQVEAIVGEVRAQAQRFLELGHDVPGYKIVQKRAQEKYVDADSAKRHAISLGLTLEEIMEEPELRSPAQLGALLEPKMEGDTKKARTAEARSQLAEFTEKVSSGTTLAREDDPRASVAMTDEAREAFAAKLEKLGK